MFLPNDDARMGKDILAANWCPMVSVGVRGCRWPASALLTSPAAKLLPAGGCLQACKCVQINKIKGFLHHKCVQ